MIKKEAIKALKEGKTLTHRYFTDEESMKQTGHLFEFEDGILCEPKEFWAFRDDECWETDWSIKEEETE